MKVSVSSIVGDLEVEEIDFGEGEIVADVFVIVRTVKPDRDHPTTSFTSTAALVDTPARLGILQMVSDKVRRDARNGWVEDDG